MVTIDLLVLSGRLVKEKYDGRLEGSTDGGHPVTCAVNSRTANINIQICRRCTSITSLSPGYVCALVATENPVLVDEF